MRTLLLLIALILGSICLSTSLKCIPIAMDRRGGFVYMTCTSIYNYSSVRVYIYIAILYIRETMPHVQIVAYHFILIGEVFLYIM